MKLSEMKKGQTGIIQYVQGSPKAIQKLQELGVVQGTSIQVLHFAVLGGPLGIKLKNYQLALRRKTASLIEVEVE
jgi:ferrous iron transport protein A